MKAILVALLAAVAGGRPAPRQTRPVPSEVEKMAAVASAQLVVVDNERVHLRDVVPNAPLALAEVDVGAAPPPGERRSISEAAIRASLKRASASADGLRIPKTIKVARRGQQLDVATIEALARRELAPLLGYGMSIDRLDVHRGVTLAEGDVVARITNRTTLRPGYQSVMLELRAGTSPPRSVTVSLNVAGDASVLMPVVKRGDRVIVLAVKGGLVVQMYAVAQQDGRIGESIPVIPMDGTKVVRAKVRDASTVEVLL